MSTTEIDEALTRIRFTETGLVAAVIQQWDTREVLMMGWMDEEAFRRTMSEGRVTFWSRSPASTPGCATSRRCASATGCMSSAARRRAQAPTSATRPTAEASPARPWPRNAAGIGYCVMTGLGVPDASGWDMVAMGGLEPPTPSL